MPREAGLDAMDLVALDALRARLESDRRRA
jgi:hypothetical protein